jgi:hypothetical protein
MNYAEPRHITNALLKISALSNVARAVAATDPDRAARLLADAERIVADEFPKGSALVDRFLRETAKAWVLIRVAGWRPPTPTEPVLSPT